MFLEQLGSFRQAIGVTEEEVGLGRLRAVIVCGGLSYLCLVVCSFSDILVHDFDNLGTTYADDFAIGNFFE
jgi:hypothetical protein